MHINLAKEMVKTRNLLPENLGKVLDIGSCNVNGSAWEVYIEDKYESYLGIDIVKGPGVDKVINAHDIKKEFNQNSFDTVICMNMMEHDDKFWVTLENINYVLKLNGFFIFCVPTFYFPEHNHPADYWRMSEAAVKDIILNKYNIIHYRKVYISIDNKPKCETCHKWVYNYIIFAIGKKII